MTDDEKNAVRAKVRANNEQMLQMLAPLYLGKWCPLIDNECKGPECGFFLPTGEGNRITGGACSIPLLASQAGPIADGLVQLAMASKPIDPARVIGGASVIR